MTSPSRTAPSRAALSRADASPPELTSPLAACTIVSKNYLPFARVLCRSFAERHPQGRFFLLLVDRNEGFIDPEEEPFEEIYEAESLPNLPDPASFLFKYTILEANTAVKPYFLEHLFETHGLEKLVYFDPDILITGSLDPLSRRLDRASVVLTPHLTDPIDDDAYPGELAILQSGTYNLGFVGLRGDATGRRLLSWWQDRLHDRCVVRIADGLFVDQKWMDLVPGLFDGVYVLRDPGYNAAYWNLHGRGIVAENAADPERAEGGFTSDGRPLVFFHFSGITPENLHPVSKHQDRFTLGDLGDAADLYRIYADKVLDAGFRECRPWPYAYATFENGVPIPDAARSLYLELAPETRAPFGDPFDSEGPSSFYAHLLGPEGDPLGRFLRYLHSSREDLDFGDLDGPGFAVYSDWLLLFGRHELGIPAPFLEALESHRAQGGMPATGLGARLRLGAKRLYRSAPAAGAKAVLRRALGSERTRSLKRRLRPPKPTAAPAPRLPPGGRPPIQRQGFNLVGYLSAETGMGEAARGLAHALELAGIPLSLHDLELGVVARRQDATYAGRESDFPYDVNLFVVNADQVPHVRAHLGEAVFAGRHNLGYWLWEQEIFPRAYWPAFDSLHEVWTASSFCVDALSGPSPIPVRRVPLPVRPLPGIPGDASVEPASARHGRESFGFGDGVFVFTFLFNYLSHFERKNPLAVVRAFRRAFGDDPSRLLLIKTSQQSFAPEKATRLEAAAEGASNIRIVDAYWPREQVLDLFRAADAYLSLHRSEGFGLTLAEAMWQRIPVVATDYSGSRDFLDPSTGFPVRWTYTPVAETAGPYPEGSRWAEPDEEHAAEMMRRVAEDRAARDKAVARAAARIRGELSPEAVAGTLRRRFDTLLERHRPLPSAGLGRG